MQYNSLKKSESDIANIIVLTNIDDERSNKNNSLLLKIVRIYSIIIVFKRLRFALL